MEGSTLLKVCAKEDAFSGELLNGEEAVAPERREEKDAVENEDARFWEKEEEE